LTTTARPSTAKKANAKVVKQPVAPVAEESQVPAPEKEANAQTGVQPAYLGYLHARKGLANAFRGRQRQDEQAYEDSQRRYRAHEDAIDRALRVREKAEREALELYRATIDSAVAKASGEYRDRMRQALAECRMATDGAWKASMETSAVMTGVFEGDRPVQPDEKPEAGSRLARIGSTIKDDMRLFKVGCLVVAGGVSRRLKRLVRRDGKRAEAGAVESRP